MNNIYQEVLNDCYLTNTQCIIVSKKRSIDEIMSYYNLGARHFGENRVDELVAKAQMLPKDIHWHFIGHLQRNKVRKVLPYVDLIHSVESLELCKILEKEAAKINKKIPILIQLNLAKEKTKTGISKEEAEEFINLVKLNKYLEIHGLMCMGPHVSENNAIEKVFQQANNLFNQLKDTIKLPSFTHLSMGMSHDYKIALKYGATYIRLGSLLFDMK